MGLIASKACECCNINNYEVKGESTSLFRGIPPQYGDPQALCPLQSSSTGASAGAGAAAALLARAQAAAQHSDPSQAY